MKNVSFDWRWVVLGGLVVLLLNAGRLPPIVSIVLLGAGGGYLLYAGWQAWLRNSGMASNNKRVTYWRGERVEIKPQRRGSGLPPISTIGPALIYLVIGGVMIFAAVSMLLSTFNIG